MKTAKKIYKALPVSELAPKVRCVTENGTQYLITENKNTGIHTLWLVGEQNFEKVDTSKSPIDLYEQIPWEAS